jgi:hypothetical protein
MNNQENLNETVVEAVKNRLSDTQVSSQYSATFSKLLLPLIVIIISITRMVLGLIPESSEEMLMIMKNSSNSPMPDLVTSILSAIWMGGFYKQNNEFKVKTYETMETTFDYFTERMQGREGKSQAKKIFVTYFNDNRDPNDARRIVKEKMYYLDQKKCIENGLNLTRIMLIKDKDSYNAMKEFLDQLGNCKTFALGCYILKEEDSTNQSGHFANYLHFNFMVIDGEELCFNNGNFDAPNIETHMLSVKNKEIAKNFNEHFNYLWEKSYQVKSMGSPRKNSDVFREIEEKCISNGFV